MSTTADKAQSDLDKRGLLGEDMEIAQRMPARTLEGHEALSADMADLQSELDRERALLKLSLQLLKRCREEGMPYYLRREIDDAITAGRNYL